MLHCKRPLLFAVSGSYVKSNLKGEIMQCGKNRTIEIPRGNSAVLQIIPKISGEEYVISGGEKVIFTVKIFSAKTSEVKLQKTLTAENYDSNGKLLLYIEPLDTVNLMLCNYKYDCALVSGDKFLTFVQPTDFIVAGICTEPETSSDGSLELPENAQISGEILYPKEIGWGENDFVTSEEIDTLFD
jgi:hypothetical protein